MPLNDVLSVIENLKSFGTTNITLLGGEPTLHPNFHEIISSDISRGVNFSINTNLIEENPLFGSLDHDSIDNVVVSLDGLTPETHDAVRGKGSFGKTLKSLSTIKSHPRFKSKEFDIDFTFVLNGNNRGEVTNLVPFAKRFGFRKINFKTLQFNDRAEKNRDSLSISGKETLDAITEFYVSSLINNNIDIEFFIPPALGKYLERVAGMPHAFWNYNGCGGTNVYTYVDLHGNNLPCPAMSREENARSQLKSRSPNLNIVNNRLEDVRERSLFLGFDQSVKDKSRNKKMHPCNKCIYSKECSPCKNEIIRGNESGTVYECAAVHDYGDDRVKGIKDEIFRENL